MAQSHVYDIQHDPVHLGDDAIGGWPPPAGVRWTRTFLIDTPPSSGLYLLAEVWETHREHNEVAINGRRIGHLPVHLGGNYQAFSLGIPDGLVTTGENVLLVQSAVDEHGLKHDNFLIQRVRIARVVPAPGFGSKEEFFKLFGQIMRASGWQLASVPGFGWSGIKKHYGGDFVFGLFDADATDILEGAHLKLSHWANEHGGPASRLAVAVFSDASSEQVAYITKELQKGSRWLPQSMTGVINLRGWRFSEPVQGSGLGYQRILFNAELGRDLQNALQRLAAPQ